MTNGALLATAEQAGFDVMITVDRSMGYQQNLSGRTIGVVVIDTDDVEIMAIKIDTISAAVVAAVPGEFSLIRLKPRKIR